MTPIFIPQNRWCTWYRDCCYEDRILVDRQPISFIEETRTYEAYDECWKEYVSYTETSSAFWAVFIVLFFGFLFAWIILKRVDRRVKRKYKS